MTKQLVAGRRANKAARAGLPKKAKRGGVGKAAAPAAAADAGREGGKGDAPRVPPARWSAERKRQARAAPRRREAAAAEEAEEEPPAARRTRELSPSQHGSHFAHGATGKVNDEWQTTREAWADVAPLLAPSFAERTVWMPFYYDGVCEQHLRALGFRNVIHDNADFFERCKDAAFMARVDLIWDNPPYTAADTKDAVLRALVGTGKPFCMLLPSSVIYAKLFRDTLAAERVQLVLPRRVRVCKTGAPPVPFKFMAWVCYDTRLPRDLYLVGE